MRVKILWLLIFFFFPTLFPLDSQTGMRAHFSQGPTHHSSFSLFKNPPSLLCFSLAFNSHFTGGMFRFFFSFFLYDFLSPSAQQFQLRREMFLIVEERFRIVNNTIWLGLVSWTEPLKRHFFELLFFLERVIVEKLLLLLLAAVIRVGGWSFVNAELACVNSIRPTDFENFSFLISREQTRIKKKEEQ